MNPIQEIYQDIQLNCDVMLKLLKNYAPSFDNIFHSERDNADQGINRFHRWKRLTDRFFSLADLSDLYVTDAGYHPAGGYEIQIQFTPETPKQAEAFREYLTQLQATLE